MAESARVELQRRIDAAEQRVSATDERVRSRVQALRGRFSGASRKPRRLLRRLGGAAGAAVALWWLSGRLPGRRKPLRGKADAPARRTLPWAELIALAWPFLPSRWRTKANPATVVALASVGVSVVSALRPASRPPAPRPEPRPGGRSGRGRG